MECKVTFVISHDATLTAIKNVAQHALLKMIVRLALWSTGGQRSSSTGIPRPVGAWILVARCAVVAAVVAVSYGWADLLSLLPLLSDQPGERSCPISSWMVAAGSMVQAVCCRCHCWWLRSHPHPAVAANSPFCCVYTLCFVFKTVFYLWIFLMYTSFSPPPFCKSAWATESGERWSMD